jgi:hypothetical protein
VCAGAGVARRQRARPAPAHVGAALRAHHRRSDRGCPTQRHRVGSPDDRNPATSSGTRTAVRRQHDACAGSLRDRAARGPGPKPPSAGRDRIRSVYRRSRGTLRDPGGVGIAGGREGSAELQSHRRAGPAGDPSTPPRASPRNVSTSNTAKSSPRAKHETPSGQRARCATTWSKPSRTSRNISRDEGLLAPHRVGHCCTPRRSSAPGRGDLRLPPTIRCRGGARSPSPRPQRQSQAAVSRCGSFQPGRGKWQV